MQTPEYHSHEEFQNRTKKLHEIKELNIEPYPHKYTPTHNTKELFDLIKESPIGNSEEAFEGTTPSVTMAGRLILFRAMGKNAFGHIQDDTGKIQIMFNRDKTTVEEYNPTEADPKPIKFIEKKIDLGDIIGVEGNLFRTHKGELTIFAKKVTLLCKSLLPLPDKHSGLADKGVRYRKRWLDLITSTESKNIFILRSKIISEIRKYFDTAGFLEVETPVLQNIYGGAQAKPFTTELNALHQQMFLRISLEIPLKKLIVGGHDKVFEIGKVFRNEGIDKTHNPEFTELEAYATYWDYNNMMSFIENLFEKLAITFFNDTKIILEDRNVTIDLKAPWIRMTMKDAIKTYGKYDIDTLTDNQMKDILIKAKFDPDTLKEATRGSLIAHMFEEFAESSLIQPHHIIDHPIETTPLCKLHRNPKDKAENLVERFESFILGGEIINAYTELNDPELQRQLLVEQSIKKEKGDEEANPLDEEFIEAICQGMPPTSGMGMGIDRLVMLLCKASSIKDVIYFPMMKNEE
jgi:lysyl-tRNA synthetase, class II